MSHSIITIKVINKISTKTITRCQNKLQEHIDASNAIYHLTHKKNSKNTITQCMLVLLEL